MHSVRRVALRSAAVALRAATPKARPAPLLSWSAHAGATLVASSRSFSKTARLANVESASQADAIPASSNGPQHQACDNASPDSKHSAAAPRDEASPVDESSPRGEAATHDRASAPTEAPLREGETPYGLFVRNIVFDATEDHLVGIFEKYGEVAKAVIVRDPRGLSRGYGFVYFTNGEAMNKAAANVHGSFWHGRRLMCNPRLQASGNSNSKKTKTRKFDGPTSCLYIGNIPYETTDAELNRLFRDLDNIRDVRVAVDRVTGWPRGFAHADFADAESAEKAHKRLQGAVLGSRELVIDFADSASGGGSRR